MNAADPLRPGAAEVPLLERLAFERLLADLMARLASVTSDRIVAEIERALAELVEFLGYDRCTCGEFTADGALNVLCSAAVGGLEPLPRGPFGVELPWFLGELRAGRAVALATIPDDLPQDASAERERCRRIGLRSHLSIPLRLGGRVIGVLSFAGLHSARTWSEEVITRLTIIGEVFANAMSRARFEEEAQRLRSRLWHADRVARVGALTAAIAHELNQPLAGILSNAQAGLRHIDRKTARPDDLRAILESIVRDDKRAAETIRAMRALLRRDDSGRARIDAAAALREVLDLLSADLRLQGIQVDVELETGCWVMADKAQIEQVALNLILNAVTAMQACPREARHLWLAGGRTRDGRVTVTVRDSGPGIAPEHADAVFEPFWSTRPGGLGLGLAICRSIVEAHGGSIEVESGSERGATIRFELPAEESVKDPAAAEPTAKESPPPSTTPLATAGPIVCVVDDDASVRESLVRLLQSAGMRAPSYASAREFLERGSDTEIACIVLDVRMPEMTGLELQEQLVHAGAPPSIVFLTANGDVATGVEAMRAGAVDFLEKPVDQDTLIAAVRKALARHAAGQDWAAEQARSRALIAKLSAREREIMEHVIRGRLNKQIAADLDIAEQTVKQHRGRVMVKMEVRSVADLVRVCETAGIAPR